MVSGRWTVLSEMSAERGDEGSFFTEPCLEMGRSCNNPWDSCSVAKPPNLDGGSPWDKIFPLDLRVSMGESMGRVLFVFKTKDADV